MKNDFDDIISLTKMLIELSNERLKEINIIVDNIIKYNIKDIDYISRVFDDLLDLLFASTDDVEKTYNKLLEYTLTFDKELSNDYKSLYLELKND